MSNLPNPIVVDLSHHNVDNYGKDLDFQQAYQHGIRGIIYKATEGLKYKDATYHRMRNLALQAGMLWGAYHFFRPGDVYAQAKFFVDTVAPDDQILMVLDHEDPGCSAYMAECFLRSLEAMIKRPGMLYTYDSFIKDQLGNQVNEYLGACRLWIARYGPEPTCQASWNSYWLWQFTGDGEGPRPHSIPGLGDKLDINHFPGDEDTLRDQWIRGPKVQRYVPPAADITTWAQATLNLLVPGKNRLKVDGSWGHMTKDALAAYQLDNELTITGMPDQATIEDMCDEVQKWNAHRTQ